MQQSVQLVFGCGGLDTIQHYMVCIRFEEAFVHAANSMGIFPAPLFTGINTMIKCGLAEGGCLRYPHVFIIPVTYCIVYHTIKHHALGHFLNESLSEHTYIYIRLVIFLSLFGL